MKQRTLGGAGILLAVVLVATGSPTAVLAEPPPQPEPTPECPATPLFRFNDERPVRAVMRDGLTVLDIPPLRGIGKAKIHLVQGRWPKRFVLRTRVAALEGFGNKTPYDELPKRRVGATLEIEIPPPWYANQPRAIDITWVDYFR